MPKASSIDKYIGDIDRAEYFLREALSKKSELYAKVGFEQVSDMLQEFYLRKEFREKMIEGRLSQVGELFPSIKGDITELLQTIEQYKREHRKN